MPGRPKAAGRAAASSFMQRQHLDANNVELGILTVHQRRTREITRTRIRASPCAAAVNDWQVAEWTEKDKRLKASILAAYEHGAAAVAEIERLAG